MTAAHPLERECPIDRAAIRALTAGEHGLVSDFAELHGFPWEDYADVYDDLWILGGREPSFHEVVRALVAQHVVVLQEGMARVLYPVDLRDLAGLALWVDRCQRHFLPLDTVLPTTA